MYNLKKIFITRMLLIVILVLCVVLAGCSTQQNLKDQNLNPDASLAETSMSSDAVQEYEETADEEDGQVTDKNDNSSNENTSKEEKNEKLSTDSTSKPTTTTHTHSYTKKIIAPTCTDSGYTLYTCKCGDSYTKNAIQYLGHDYTCTVIKEATTSSAGYEEYKCKRCGNNYSQTIPKKPSATGIDPAVTIGTTGYANSPLYTLGTCRVIDKRTWGDPPVISVYNGNCMHVEYYNKNGEKVEFDVKPPNAEGWLNVYGIKDDGTYTNSLISGYA